MPPPEQDCQRRKNQIGERHVDASIDAGCGPFEVNEQSVAVLANVDGDMEGLLEAVVVAGVTEASLGCGVQIAVFDLGCVFAKPGQGFAHQTAEGVCRGRDDDHKPGKAYPDEHCG